MAEMLSHGFMLRAMCAGLLVATLLAIMSVFIVLKKLSFIGVGISHSAFGGVAIGAFLGVDLTLSALVFSTGVALLIGWLSRRARVHADISIGIVFATSMSLGVVILGLSKGYNVDLFSYLFGSILAVTNRDLVYAFIVFVMMILAIRLLFKELLVYCFDEEWARAGGINTDRLQDAFLVMIAVTVVVSIKLLGIVLVSALLVIPGAIGLVLAQNYRIQLIISIVSAITSTVAGLSLSYWFDIASGAAIVLFSAMLFICATTLSSRYS